MNKTVAAFYVLLGSCAFALSIFVSRSVGNVVVLLAYGVFFVAAVTANTDLRSRDSLSTLIPFHYHPALLVSAAVLWAVFIIGFALNPSFRAFSRLGVFTVLSAITLFVVPAAVPRERAFRAIAVLGAMSVVIALPSIVWPNYTVLGVEIAQTSTNQRTALTLGFIEHTPFSFFDVVTYFRELATSGAVCAAGLLVIDRDVWLAAVCALNLFGVFLGSGTATALGLLAVGLLAATYRVAGSDALAGITVVSIVAVIVGFAVAVELLPGPTATLQSLLGKRLTYWTAAYEAFLVRPVLGWGLADMTTIVSEWYSIGDGSLTGVHNSYLRLFVIGGVVGGVAYLALSTAALALAFRTVTERAPLGFTAYGLVVVALVIQLFTGATIFGTNLSSVLWALAIAYAQPGVAAERSANTHTNPLRLTQQTL